MVLSCAVCSYTCSNYSDGGGSGGEGRVGGGGGGVGRELISCLPRVSATCKSYLRDTSAQLVARAMLLRQRLQIRLCCLTQSPHTDTEQTSPSAGLTTLGATGVPLLSQWYETITNNDSKTKQTNKRRGSTPRSPVVGADAFPLGHRGCGWKGGGKGTGRSE